ncbi:MAG: type II toxin-antitoxin system PemK/MazF family toxin [Betaproteobacteria bacterium]|nr:type II toxin-antitoxin system PemK/MazF family toxin [Betaproteobacteria bacterium]
MPPTTSYSFGDIVLVPFPFTDQTGAKKRPAVVVSSAAYHAARRDVLIMAVTSQSRPAGAIGELTVKDWKGAGLLKPSVIKPVITTIEASPQNRVGPRQPDVSAENSAQYRHQERASKPSQGPYFSVLALRFNGLRWSDPDSAGVSSESRPGAVPSRLPLTGMRCASRRAVTGPISPPKPAF